MLIFFRKHYPHYSRFFAFFIHFAIYIRAAAAMLRRIFLPATTRKSHSNGLRWRIVSPSPEKIRHIIGSDAVIDNDKPTDVILDDSSLSYQDIIKAIDSAADGKLRFHIFSSRNSIIISP